jgi:hypothetical protein
MDGYIRETQISLQVCIMCVCTYVSECLCVCVFMYVCMCVFLYVYIFVSVH